MANVSNAGVEALRRLKATEPPSWLAPNPSLAEAARTASKYLFSSLKPFSPKSPLEQLLVDGFDAEQIWQQIDIQSQPLLSTLRRRVKQLAENHEEIAQLKVPLEGGNKKEEKNGDAWEVESDGFDDELDEDEEEEEDEVKEGEEEEGEGMEEDEESEEENEESKEENEEGGGIEDKFLKIDELTKYLEKEEENFENDDPDRVGEEEDDDEDEESDEVSMCSFA